MNPAVFSAQGGTIPQDNTNNNQNQNQNHHNLQRHIAAQLQQRGPLTGWRHSVPLVERTTKVFQLISSLRLLGMDPKEVIAMAITLEERIICQSADEHEYVKQINDKLRHIQTTRQQRALQLQSGMASQPSPMGSIPAQGQIQPGLQTQWNRQMQTPQSMPTSQMSMTPQQQQQQQHHQQRPAMGINIPNQMQGFAPNGQQQRPDVNTGLTPQEMEMVYRAADQKAAKASAADMEIANRMFQSLPQEHHVICRQKGIPPIQYIHRLQALKQAHNKKRESLAMAARAQADPNLAGSVDHIQGQQVDGMRSQEAGHLVVPATGAPMVGQQPFVSQQGVLPTGQQSVNRPGVNPALVAQQQQQQQRQQEKMQQAQAQAQAQGRMTQAQAQAQAQGRMTQAQAQAQAEVQARARAHAQAQMAMPSQQTPQMTHAIPQQQSPAMSMINRPVPPSQLPQSHATPHPPAATPRPHLPQGLPASLQSELASMSPEKVAMVLQNFQQRSFPNNQNLQRPGQPGLPMQQSPVHEPSQVAQPQNSHQMMDSNARAMRQHMAGMNGMSAQTQQSMIHQQQPHSQQQQQQNPQSQQQQLLLQNQMLRQQYMRKQAASMEMTETQLQNMDRFPFPQGILNTDQTLSGSLPNTVRTWGQLKQWVDRNPQLAGDFSLHKLLMLQKVHFSQYLKVQRESASRNVGQNGLANAGMGQKAVPSHIFGQQVPQPGQPTGQHQYFQNARHLRPFNAADIKAMRDRLGESGQKLNDDNIKQILETNRQRNLLAQQMRGQQQVPTQPFNQAQLTGFQPPQQPSVQPPQQPVVQTSPPQQPPVVLDNNATIPNPSHASQPKQGTRGVKRPSPSDNEAGMNNTNVPQQMAAPTQAGAQQPGFPITREQFTAMTPQQRAQFEAGIRQRQRQRQGQTKPPISKAAAEDAWNRIPESFKRIYAEHVRADEAAVPVALTSTQKAAMGNQLRESTDMLSRVDSLILYFMKFQGIEEQLKNLLGVRMRLMKQFQGPDWEPADQFTISPEKLASDIFTIRKWFSTMMNQVSVRKQAVAAAASARAGASQSPPAQQDSMHPLNATNLQQHNQQQAALQRERRVQAHNVPQAPTTTEPPFALGAASPQAPTATQPSFALGATSPQGVPHRYGPSAMNPDNLTIPPSKKHKRNPPGVQKDATKQSAAQLSVQDQKPTPSDAGKPALKAVEAFKCVEAECTAHIKGFASQADLDKHVEEYHKADELIEDPLQYALDSYRMGLGLDKEKKDPVEDEKNGQASEEKAPRSVKLGATPSASQMARAASTGGVKASSPGSNLAKTPQANALKPPSTLQTKPTPNLESRKEDIVKASESSPKDPWEGSPVSLEAIRTTFSDIGDEAFFNIGNDSVKELLASEAFTNIQTKDTPQSVDTGANTQTPQDSDISKDDDARMATETPPSDWVHLPTNIADSLMMVEDIWEWESIIVDDAAKQ